jgi:hypothetical protein
VQALLPVVHIDHATFAVPTLLASYLSEAQLAQQLDVTTRTLQRWRRQRTGPPVTMIGGSPMYRIASIETWLLSREIKMVRERPRGRAAEPRQS